VSQRADPAPVWSDAELGRALRLAVMRSAGGHVLIRLGIDKEGRTVWRVNVRAGQQELTSSSNNIAMALIRAVQRLERPLVDPVEANGRAAVPGSRPNRRNPGTLNV